MSGVWRQVAILNRVIRIDLLTEKVIFEPSQIWKEMWEVPILGVRFFQAEGRASAKTLVEECEGGLCGWSRVSKR